MPNNVDQGYENEIDLLDLLRELLGHRWLIIICTAVMAIGSCVFSLYCITPMYQSTAEMFVLSKSTSITSLADLQMGTYLTNDYAIVVTGRPVLEQVSANLGLNESYNSLKSRVRVNNPNNTRIIQVTVTDSNPYRAKQIVDEVAEVSAAFISEKMDQDPPSIITYGYDDGTPVSPSITKNTLMGAMVGAVLSMGVVVLLYLINDTIRTPEDVERKLGLNVIGQIPLGDEFDDEGKRKKRRKKNK
ncbi:MAG: capsular biosynthesis protein [Pseudobutyrivibrio sp.]|nr:capsular biosynthesis protein [Pseudobutyrivibrio sp.]